MLITSIIAVLTISLLIGFVIFKPTIKVYQFKFESFWVIALLGAFLLILLNQVSIDEALSGLVSNTGMNPVWLLVIFISMSGLSIMLDQLGFFKMVSYYVLKKAGRSQFKIFIYLYTTVALLTIFTSNDIIILTFTPIICYFAKHAKINPLPFLIGEFVAANTWSLMLIIGNPTNIYIASSFDITFVEYFQVMFIPTIVTGLFTFLLLILLFRKDLKKPIEVVITESISLKNKVLVIIVLMHLILCTILLTISSYIGLEMYLICLSFLLSACFMMVIYEVLVNKSQPVYFVNTLKNMPWNVIPFVVSMFIIVIGLNKYDVTKMLSDSLSHYKYLYSYGITSFLSSNLVNNIPMSVLYTDMIGHIPITDISSIKQAVYASVIGSNIGAYFTPIGALAGIMWMRMLKTEGMDFSFVKFVKYGVVIAIPTILVSLFILSFMI